VASTEAAWPSNRKEQILLSAARIFFSKGYHATTIEDVARDVGMLKGSLYYYINSKEDLLYELLLGVIEHGDAYIRTRLAGISDPVEALRIALRGHIEYIIENQVHVGLFLHEFDTLPGRRQKRIRDAMQGYQQMFIDIVRRGQTAGKFVTDDPWVLVNGMLGMGNWIYRWYHGKRLPGRDTVQATFVSLLMNGILKK
jgi:AcrR family transcriptional regulator